MSTNGDVVWSAGAAWQRDNDAYSLGRKEWWVGPCPQGGSETARLKDLKRNDDFTWLVKDGVLADYAGQAELDANYMRAQREVILDYQDRLAALSDKFNQLVSVNMENVKGRDELQHKVELQRLSILSYQEDVRWQGDVKDAGRADERNAIVAWLRARPSGYYGGARVASEIERGIHLRGDDE